MTAPGMPYGSLWYLNEHLVIAADASGDPGRCRVLISSEVMFTKKVMAKKMPLAGFKQDLKKTFAKQVRPGGVGPYIWMASEIIWS